MFFSYKSNIILFNPYDATLVLFILQPSTNLVLSMDGILCMESSRSGTFDFIYAYKLLLLVCICFMFKILFSKRE